MLYPKQYAPPIEPYYSRHVSAMTSENLHAKADIAEQLAWRDKRIAELEQTCNAQQDTIGALKRQLSCQGIVPKPKG